jgi:hypothetical protein
VILYNISLHPHTVEQVEGEHRNRKKRRDKKTEGSGKYL